MKAKAVALLLVTKVVPIVVGLAVLVGAIAWLAGAFSLKIESGAHEPSVRKYAGQKTDEVHEITKEYIEESVGSLKAASRTAISAKVLATILEIPVTAGEQVQPGDLLVRLDGKELQTRVNQAEHTVKEASAAREEAESNFNRVKSLVDQRAMPRAQLDQATAKLQVAKATESRVMQAVEEAKAMLSYTEIHAPKAGLIVDRLAEPGDMARPGEPLLLLYDPTTLRLEAPVQEELAFKLRIGESLDVHIDAPGLTVAGTIAEIVPQADAPSRSFLVKVALPRSEDLREGMFGRLRIPAGTRRHLCLATDAIERIGQLEFVDVVLPDETLERRFIKTGRLGMPGRIEVLSGLEAGELVVLHSDVAPATASQER